ncbi:hypothetical protein DY000_02052455 [Brassica cretica]|nr:hypothetical protein DY000_02052455 [Brassica cretica]
MRMGTYMARRVICVMQQVRVLEVDKKAQEDCREWTQAHEAEDPRVNTSETELLTAQPQWEAPVAGWFKCDIGVHWCITHQRSFLDPKRLEWCGDSMASLADVKSATDANANAYLWAIESMGSLRKNKVVFGVEASELFRAVL